MRLNPDIEAEEQQLRRDNQARADARRTQFALDGRAQVAPAGAVEDEPFPRPMTDAEREELAALRRKYDDADRERVRMFDLELKEGRDRVWRAEAQRADALRQLDAAGEKALQAALAMASAPSPTRLQAVVRTAFGLTVAPAPDADQVLGYASALFNQLQAIATERPRVVDAACGGGTALRWRNDHQRLGQRIRDLRGSASRTVARAPVPLGPDIEALLTIVHNET